MARPDKAAVVKDIAGRFKAAEAALLTDYRGLRVGEIAEVRNAVRAADAEYKVLKNTLTRIAVREVGLDELVSMLEGPTAVAFCHGDAAAVARALDEAAKKFPVLVIKGGVLAGKIIGADEARRLAKLEPRDVQLAMIVTMMNAPLQQTANVLSALLRDLGSMLAQVAAEKAEQESEHEDSALGERIPVPPSAGGRAVPPEEAGEEQPPQKEEEPAEKAEQESEHEDSALGERIPVPPSAGGRAVPPEEAGEEQPPQKEEEPPQKAEQESEHEDAALGGAVPPEEAGEEAAPEEQPSAETIESEAVPGGAEAAEQAKEEAKQPAEGGEGIDAAGGGENRQGAGDGDGADSTPGGAKEE